MTLKINGNVSGSSAPAITVDSVEIVHNASAANGAKVYARLNPGDGQKTVLMCKSDSANTKIATSGNGYTIALDNYAMIESTVTVQYENPIGANAYLVYLNPVKQVVPTQAIGIILSQVIANSNDGTWSDDIGRAYFVGPTPSVTNLPQLYCKEDGSSFAGGPSQPSVIISNYGSAFQLNTNITDSVAVYYDTSSGGLKHSDVGVGTDIQVTIPATSDSQIFGGQAVLDIYYNEDDASFYHNFSFIPETINALVSNEVGYIPLKYSVSAGTYPRLYFGVNDFEFVSPTSQNSTSFTSSTRQPDYIV